MTTTELNKFRKALEDKQAEIGGGSFNRQALMIETSSDELDRIQNASERDYAMGNLERDSNRRREVRSALRRMDEGTFGVCAGCDAAINQRRLQAVPWATFCIVCQEAADLARVTPGGELDSALQEAA